MIVAIDISFLWAKDFLAFTTFCGIEKQATAGYARTCLLKGRFT
jgi:hypothetical protein